MWRDLDPGTQAGAEPGINPSTSKYYSYFKEECAIEVVDYSNSKISHLRLRNEEFIELMKTPEAGSNDDERMGVRWINIGGLDWGVISAVGVKYNLHALALEDVLHEQGHNQSKADYYPDHLFIRILCHTLEHEDDSDHSEQPEPMSGLLDSALERGQLPTQRKGDLSSGEAKESDVKTPTPTSFPITKRPRDRRRRITSLTGFLAPTRRKQILQIKALTRGERVNIRHEPMSIFLLRNGTVISITPKPTLELTTPISERLEYPDSVLRTSEDASLLVESILDLIVDRVLEIMDEYQDKIHKLEHDALLRPNLDTMRSLHILSGDLILHKRTLDPIKTLIYGLRQHDLDRCTALANNLAREGERLEHGSKHQDSDRSDRDPRKHKKKPVQGFLSYKTKVYLADVYDHIEFVLTTLDMFHGISENLINFAFNAASYQMNQVMRRLTLATIIFLPLTLLTGYFGMNFMDFPAIQGSYLLFWTISLPVMAAVIPVFMFTDIQQLVHYMKKLMVSRNSVKGS